MALWVALKSTAGSVLSYSNKWGTQIQKWLLIAIARPATKESALQYGQIRSTPLHAPIFTRWKSEKTTANLINPNSFVSAIAAFNPFLRDRKSSDVAVLFFVL